MNITNLADRFPRPNMTPVTLPPIIFVIGKHTSSATCPPRILTVQGAPGVGKETHCRRLADDHQIGHLPVGDWTRGRRGIIANDGRTVDFHRDRNEPIPGNTLVPLLETELKDMTRKNKDYKAILLDGFPRSQEQLDAWNAVVSHPATS